MSYRSLTNSRSVRLAAKERPPRQDKPKKKSKTELEAELKSKEEELSSLRQLFDKAKLSEAVCYGQYKAKEEELSRLTIERDKEFWKQYADDTCRNLADSNAKLTAELGKQEEELSRLRAELDDTMKRIEQLERGNKCCFGD